MRAEKIDDGLAENNTWRILDDEGVPLTDFACRASVKTAAGAMRAYKAFLAGEAEAGDAAAE